MTRHGGKVLADQLAVHGAKVAFGVPGESYLALLDGLYDSPIRFVTCRHEAGAANMAEAYGKLTGRPGLCLVTRGPGATQASVGVHTAFQDSTPMILLVGQVGSDMEEREAFQEIDFRRMFGPLAKWVAQIDRVERIPELVARAFATACAGRPGPVVLALPEDMLSSEVDVHDARPFHVVRPSPSASDVEAVHTVLAGAERPLAILGGAGWTAAASRDLRVFLEANALPAGAAFRRQDSLDHDSPSYVGDIGIGLNPKLAARVREADVLLVVGPRLGEMTTSGYTLLDVPDSYTFIPARRSWGACTAQPCRSSPRPRRSPPPWPSCASNPAGGSGPPPPAPTSRRGSGTNRCRASSISANASRSSGSVCPTQSCATAPATTPSGSTASGASTTFRRSSRRRAARWATACRPQSRRRRCSRSGR
jgi:thiamine pyrophosphate-dependent acetolactate synthase large subunit-like protein